jgi:Sigma-70 factor, region 1.1
MPRNDIIRKAIELGRQRGFVTFDELNKLLPSAMTAPQDIEALMVALSNEGIDVIEDEGP